MSNSAERSLHTRAARSVDALRSSFTDNLFCLTGRSFQQATLADFYTALAHTVRDHMLERLIISGENYRRSNARTVCYFSAEFLLGPHLGNT